MARERSFYRDFLPILVLLGTEFNDMGLLTLFKVASLQGLNSYVFVAYAYAVATTVLLPVTFFHRRSRVVPPLSFSTVSKIVLLGVIGSSSQILGYAGISYSSPALASSIGNLVPALTFILAVICRMEKLAAKSRSSQAKVMGSIISISGAFVLTFYKGPSIVNAHKHLSLSLQDQINFLKSEDASWATGGILLIADYILTSVWYILEEDILRVFPDELTLVLLYNVTATIFTANVGLFAEPSASAWKIGLNVSLISIVSSGLFGKLMSNVVYAWTLNLKGAVFVTSFRPLQIVIAVAMGVLFLDDTLYIGSVVGAIIVSIGLYVVLWGKATEEIEEVVGGLESLTAENVPLLQNQRTETSEKNV
ncbi:WAT1-related protein At3g28050-like [Vigna umbellata]|uniref:WAT1-related protein At3g28050-like n=1 Tax=Vigna umbellata TaxID=87088 RepID=UPI001F5E79FE|nr:WAT1-related protein At3g28050-like [Vigna umbellata]